MTKTTGKEVDMITNKRVAFITAANRGIGLETARELGQKGIAVVLGARDYNKGQIAERDLKRSGIEAKALEFDVLREEHHCSAYRYFEERYGKLDILINNAGAALEDGASDLGHVNTVSTTSIELLRRIFDVNFFGVFALTQALLPLIRQAPSGRVVNVSSRLDSLTWLADSASAVAPYRYFAYGISKAALNAFTLYLADELRNTRIKVNSAEPGWVNTDMGGAEADLELREGGKTSAWLATLPGNGPTGGYFTIDAALPRAIER
jgi:NAD(P)-dependent dehydrogenase (short-subunit alcohol dehydrogenase family)